MPSGLAPNQKETKVESGDCDVGLKVKGTPKNVKRAQKRKRKNVL